MPQTIKLNVPRKDSEHALDLTWIDVDLANSEDFRWISTQSGLCDNAKTLLLHPSRVCRRENLEQGLYVNLCGIDPDKVEERDVISVGVFIEDNRVITVRSGMALKVEDIRKESRHGKGSGTAIEFLAFLIMSFKARLESITTLICEETDELEDRVLIGTDNPPLNDLDSLRRKVFRIRRYLVQTQNVLKLIISDISEFASLEESYTLNGVAEYIARYLGSIEDCRYRTELLHDRIEGKLSQSMANTNYKLTIVATVFLPLTFITGLLGMNVAGIPETHNPWGFWIVCALLIALAIVAWGLLGSRRWK